MFGQAGGGTCFDQTLNGISGQTFRARGVNASFAGERGRWNYGLGAGYANRRYYVPTATGFAGLPTEDETISVYGSLGRQLSRTSEINLDGYVSWYSSDLAGADDVTGQGATLSYNRSFLLDRLQLLAALGLYHSDLGVEDSTSATASAGLRYSFW